MRRLPNNQMEFNIGLGVKAHSLDVVADIIGTMRMQKIIEITEKRTAKRERENRTT